MWKHIFWVFISLYLLFFGASAQAEWDGKSPVDAPKMNVGDSWVFKDMVLSTKQYRYISTSCHICRT